MTKQIKKWGSRIRAFRRKKELRQTDLADICGIHHTYISQIERGRRADVSVRIMLKIANGLNVSLDDILN